jgi:hypothetical protein
MSKRLDDVKELPAQVRGAADAAVRALKDQARRPDRVGEVTHRTWELVHGGVGAAARSLSRLEQAIQPPARVMRRTPASRPRSSRPQDRAEKPKGDSSNG